MSAMIEVMQGRILVTATALAAAVGCVGQLEGGGDGGGAVAGSSGSSGSGAGGAGAAAGTSGGAGASTGGSAGIGTAQCEQVGVDSGAGVLRRLSNLEYQLTLQDLFQLSAPPAIDAVPPDIDQDGFKSFAALQSVSAQHLRAYLDTAHGLADALLADATRSSAVIGCALDATDCLSSFVTRFGKLAYRRPLAPEEVTAIVAAATADALDETDRYRFAIETLLTSPNFLYRVEVGDLPEGLATLTPLELASRLSFALWGRAPSEALLDEAAAGALDTPEGLAQKAQQMLADPRAQTFFNAFFRQWLGFEQMRQPVTPPSDWDPALLSEMARETERVTADYAWGGRNFLEVLTTNTTRLGPELAAFYGVTAPGADSPVEFAAGHPRANTGLLTHASLLSAKSDGDPIVLRGNWVRKTFLCQHLEAPADLADTIGELLVGQSRIEIVKTRNTMAECKTCHAAIDPIGVGFAQFDATGRFDATLDDASVYGITPGLPDAQPPGFANIAELAAKLAALPRVSECLSERAFLYANGREPVAADVCTIESAETAFAGSGHDFKALLAGLVEAPGFRLRRAPAATP